jgi:hypothetical protein
MQLNIRIGRAEAWSSSLPDQLKGCRFAHRQPFNLSITFPER